MFPVTPTGFLPVLGLYILATLLFSLRVIFSYRFFSALGLRLTVGAFLLHFSFLSFHLWPQGYPFLISRFDNLQLTSLVLVFIFILLCFFYRFAITGVVLLPLSLLFYIVSLVPQVDYRHGSHFLENPFAFVHLVFICISMAIFMVSLVTGLLYLAQEYRIKNKKAGGFLDRFPALTDLNSIHARALSIGFFFFTVGLAAGIGWSKSISGSYFDGSLKQAVSVGVWVFFLLLLNWRVPQGWVGRKGILLSSVGFAALIFLLFWI